ncbi:MAG: hypothetical protein AABY22_18220, partial [Nanoarchaeota archaeon]
MNRSRHSYYEEMKELKLKQHDEYGYLKTAKNLQGLGYGITIGKGREKQLLDSDRSSKLFGSLF